MIQFDDLRIFFKWVAQSTTSWNIWVGTHTKKGPNGYMDFLSSIPLIHEVFLG